MEQFYDIGIFALEVIIVTLAIVIGYAYIKQTGGSTTPSGKLIITDIGKTMATYTKGIRSELFTKKQLKDEQKLAKEKSQNLDDKIVYVLDFTGDIQAKQVESLRKEVDAIVSVANSGDEVIVRLESGGGVVHGYGLAASQLSRIKAKGIQLTICVDKVAASGGYMMACIADKIISAPFAIIGSIGVIAQIPNFNKLLKKYNVDFEQITSGEFKRTVTMFGENTDAGREKFKGELEETHTLFKLFVSKHRASLDVDKVATGEHWFGSKAFELGLIDEIGTSDDYIMQKASSSKVLQISFKQKKNFSDKLSLAASTTLESLFIKLIEKQQNTKFL